MQRFEWISCRAVPIALDLRRRGWRLVDDTDGGHAARLIDAAWSGRLPGDFPVTLRARSLALGIADSDGRARWLAAGYGDALGADTGLDELALRAGRIARGPPQSFARGCGRLALDLVVRDARVDGHRLRLYPREFALLWRLAEAAGGPVTRKTLLRDVFDLGFDPGTNRVAVHICRLRKKLAFAGLDSLLVTGSGDGAYRLVPAPSGEPAHAAAAAFGEPRRELAL